jgi:hypothetical protein
MAGRILSHDGRPDTGLRVYAVQVNPGIASEEMGLIAAVAETDRAGRFKLQGLAGGAYYIAAGLLESPTYFPGVTNMTAARAVGVTGDDTKDALDFTLNTAAFDAMIEAKEVPIKPGSIQPTGQAVTATTKLKLRQTLQAESEGQMWAARILELQPDGFVKVHYLGWDAAFDDIVARYRLQLDDRVIEKTRKPDEWTGQRGLVVSHTRMERLSVPTSPVFIESNGKAVVADTILNGYGLPLSIASILAGAALASLTLVSMVRKLRAP